MSHNLRTLVIAVALLVGGVMGEAQQAKKFPRIGYVGAASHAVNASRVAAFQQGLRDLGCIEWKNIALEWRFADGKTDRPHELPADLIRLNLQVLVSGGTVVTRVLKEAKLLILQ